jgi:hypothetical protein
MERPYKSLVGWATLIFNFIKCLKILLPTLQGIIDKNYKISKSQVELNLAFPSSTNRQAASLRVR